MLPNNVWLWWDGISTLYVDAAASHRGNLDGGLCGNFNGDLRDDLSTQEEDLQDNVAEFANRLDACIAN